MRIRDETPHAYAGGHRDLEPSPVKGCWECPCLNQAGQNFKVPNLNNFCHKDAKGLKLISVTWSVSASLPSSHEKSSWICGCQYKKPPWCAPAILHSGGVSAADIIVPCHSTTVEDGHAFCRKILPLCLQQNTQNADLNTRVSGYVCTWNLWGQEFTLQLQGNVAG